MTKQAKALKSIGQVKARATALFESYTKLGS